MKCQNCGNNQVNFHYSSNINGCVTETHLCAECAARQGYDSGIFNGFFPSFGGLRQRPMQAPVFAALYPFSAPPRMASKCGCEECGCQSETRTPAETVADPVPDIDTEMKKRRELNAMREQMRIAAENDDFEKAVELRDRLKELES